MKEAVQMKWTEIKILTTYEAAEAIGEILYNNGADGIVVEDITPVLDAQSPVDWDYSDIPEADFPPEEVRLVAYLPTTSDLPGIIENIHESVDNLVDFDLNVGEASFTLTEVEEQDWQNNWKQYYKPVEVGQRLLIKPVWENIPINEDKIVIIIDPGMAFGTGTHATTMQCLCFLEQYGVGKQRLYDVGTGSGILSITAAKLGIPFIMAFDKDDVAVRVAGENIALNQLDAEITLKVNNLLEGITEKVDIIVANITAGILTRLIPDAAKLLLPEGHLICSGIITEREVEVQKALVAHGFIIIDRLIDGDWVSLVAQRL